MVGQVSHPGRQTPEDIQPSPISASSVQLIAPHMHKTYAVPRAATLEEIDSVVESFAYAAEYLDRAGFDGIMLHAAHGYLLAQFLSPRTNQRTDEYGGSLENRMRLILRIARVIRQRLRKDFILGIKVNSVEFQDRGFTSAEAVLLCQALEDAHFDYVETSGGTYENSTFAEKESTRKRESYFGEFAEQIAKGLKVTKVYTTGGLKTLKGMIDTLQSVDGLGIARAAAQEPRLAHDILSGKVTGIIKYVLDEDNFGLRLLATQHQFRQIGNGEEPANLSDPEVVKGIFSKLFGQSS
jgi:2,4-dienoyl-CoA reductase-like NADH-dependent reductase (Old Yellow Enzyme family)